MDARKGDDATRGGWWWAAWLATLAVFTYGLVMPMPPSDAPLLPPEVQFVVQKGVHVGGYALLAALTACLPASRAVRLALLAFLAVHACGTEVAQSFTETRTGSVRDVGIDLVGVTLGTALTRRRWRRVPPE
ncbi:MAG: VanZ family protein [Gemmataceae bacterium]